jgi:hypothetical protein
METVIPFTLMKFTARSLLALALFAAVVGCKPKAVGTSSIFAGNGDRSVNVTAEGPAFASPQPDKLIVTLQGHEVVIEKERLLVDKTEAGKVPAEAKKFDVTFTGGTLTVSADGAEIVKTPLQR